MDSWGQAEHFGVSPVRLLIHGDSITTVYSLPAISDLPEVVTLEYLIANAATSTCKGESQECFVNLQETSSITVDLGRLGSLILFQHQARFQSWISSLEHSGSINSEIHRFCHSVHSLQDECEQGAGHWDLQVLRGVLQILHDHVMYAGVAGFSSLDQVRWFLWGLFEKGTLAVRL